MKLIGHTAVGQNSFSYQKKYILYMYCYDVKIIIIMRCVEYNVQLLYLHHIIVILLLVSKTSW